MIVRGDERVLVQGITGRQGSFWTGLHAPASQRAGAEPARRPRGRRFAELIEQSGADGFRPQLAELRATRLSGVERERALAEAAAGFAAIGAHGHAARLRGA